MYYSGNIQTPLNACSATLPLRVVIGHNSTHNSKLQTHLQQLGKHQLNHLGSALKFCQIAEGVYDYYPRFGPCCEWDTAQSIYLCDSIETLNFSMNA
jgi:3'(2'), 5'-bisphosphate nucleotidase